MERGAEREHDRNRGGTRYLKMGFDYRERSGDGTWKDLRGNSRFKEGC